MGIMVIVHSSSQIPAKPWEKNEKEQKEPEKLTKVSNLRVFLTIETLQWYHLHGSRARMSEEIKCKLGQIV